MSFFPSTAARFPSSSRSLLPSTSSSARRSFTPTSPAFIRRKGPSTMGISQDVVSDYELNGPKKGRAVKEKGGQKVDYESKKPVLEGGKFSSRQLRDLTSLYHDAQNHINYDNLDSIIDAEFAPPTPRTRPPMASLQDLHIEMTAPNSLSHRQALTTPAISERRSFVSNQEDPYKFNVFHPLAESGSEARNKVVRDQETARRIAAWTRLTDPRVAGAIGGAASIKLRKELEAEEEKEDLFGEGAASSLTDQSSQDSSAFALAGRKNDWAASTEYDLTERQRRLVETLLGLEANGTRPNMEEVLREQPRIAAEEEKVRIYWEAGLDEEFGELSAEQEERVREVAERVEEKMGEEMRKSLGMREREEAGLMMDGEEEALGEERV